MRRRKKKLKTAIYRRFCIIFPFSSFPRAACRLVLIGLLLCVGASIAVTPATAAEKKSEKPYALIFGTVWGPDNRPLYGVKVKIRRADPRSRTGSCIPTIMASSRRGFLRVRRITWYGPISRGISILETTSYRWVPRSRYTLNMTSEPTLVCI